MKTRPALVAAVAALAAAFSVAAQAETTSRTRADVKAETVRAAATGQLARNGEQTPFLTVAPSTLNRADVKQETVRLGQQGLLPTSAREPEWKEQRRMAARPSTVNPAERRAEVRAANRAGQLALPGEAGNAPEFQRAR